VDYPEEDEADLILPSKAVQELLHVLHDEGDMRVTVKENQVVFEFGDVMIASKLIDGTYPNYRQVIPTQCEQRITVEREALLTALRRSAILTVDKTSGTKLTFADNKVTVVTSNAEIGESRETVPVKYNGKPITVAFNADYMMDPLRNLSSDEIYIELTDELSPGVIKADIPFLYVLMPMRLN
jgi:DNA polymerase-3 subunit beta